MNNLTRNVDISNTYRYFGQESLFMYPGISKWSTVCIDPADHKVVRIAVDCKFKSFEYWAHIYLYKDKHDMYNKLFFRKLL